LRPYEAHCGQSRRRKSGQGVDAKVEMLMKPGLYANINAKKARIAAGSGEKMRKPGTKGAPTAADFRKSAKTRKK
jgi:hypothetical protein